MAHETTLYSVLRVPEEASPEEIKQAYRRLVKLWHPDLHPDDMSAEKRMQEITEAYTVLSDPAKKQKYDSKLSQTRAAERARQEEQARKAARAAAAVNQANAAKNKPVTHDPDRPPQTSGSDSYDSSYVDFTKPSEMSSPFVVNGNNAPSVSHSDGSGVPVRKTSGTMEELSPGEKGMENISVALCVFFPLLIPIVRKHLKESLELYPDSPHYQDCFMSLRIVTVFALPLWVLLVILILKAVFKF